MIDKSYTDRLSLIIKLTFIIIFLPNATYGMVGVVNRYMPHLHPVKPLSAVNHGIALTYGVLGAQAAHAYDQERAAGYYPKNGNLEFDGQYDLQNIAQSLEEYSLNETGDFVNPFYQELGGAGWLHEKIPFEAHNSISAIGNYFSLWLPLTKKISCNVVVPFYFIEGREAYRLKNSELERSCSLSDHDQVDRIRRFIHQRLGFAPGDWRKEHLGDIPVSLCYSQSAEYLWLFRSAKIDVGATVVVPTGLVKQHDAPASLPFGNDGHWSYALTVHPELELKESIKVGCAASVVWLQPKTKEQRIAVHQEPSLYSPLIAHVRVSPGFTYRFHPTISYDHFLNNLHLQLGYCYTKHYSDTLAVEKNNFTTTTYLDRAGNNNFEKHFIYKNQQTKKELSEWFNSYITLRASYQLSDFLPQLRKAPVIDINFDYAFGGKKSSRTYQLTTSLSWFF